MEYVCTPSMFPVGSLINMDYRIMCTVLTFVFSHSPLSADLMCKCSKKHICAEKARVLIL